MSDESLNSVRSPQATIASSSPDVGASSTTSASSLATAPASPISLPTAPVVALRGVCVGTSDAPSSRLHDITFDIAEGECVGLIGESGSGKTMLAMTIAGLLPSPLQRTSGDIAFRQTPHCAVVFQDARAALNPVRRIRDQFADLLATVGVPRAQYRSSAIEWLTKVAIDEPMRALDSYPFMLSGGTCQRILIALTLARRPALLIADEPTTGLDTITQAAVLDLLLGLAREQRTGVLLITHDLPVAIERCERIAVMRAGTIDTIAAATTFASTQAPTPPSSSTSSTSTVPALSPSQATIAEAQHIALPKTTRTASTPSSLLLRASGVTKRFVGRGRQPIAVLDGLDFQCDAGDIVGIIGRSGSGKSTLAAALARLLDIDSGRIMFDAIDIAATSARQAFNRPWRHAVQLVFQDARASLNPLKRCGDAIADGLISAASSGPSVSSKQERVAAIAEQLSIPLPLLERLPHTLSGGEAARVAIARAIARQPRLLIMDEATASLDPSVQSSLLAALKTRCRQDGLTIVFVSHDLDAIRSFCDRVVVIDAGRAIENGSSETVFATPEHPLTQALLRARPQR